MHRTVGLEIFSSLNIESCHAIFSFGFLLKMDGMATTLFFFEGRISSKTMVVVGTDYIVLLKAD